MMGVGGWFAVRVWEETEPERVNRTEVTEREVDPRKRRATGKRVQVK